MAKKGVEEFLPTPFLVALLIFIFNKDTYLTRAVKRTGLLFLDYFNNFV